MECRSYNGGHMVPSSGRKRSCEAMIQLEGRSRITRWLTRLVVIAITTFVLAEVALQFTARVNPGLIAAATESDERFWEKRFVERHEKNAYVYGGLHEPHPTRGWILKRSFSRRIWGSTYTLNDRGYRSRTNHQEDPSRFTVLLVGDSFTFGLDANDGDIWPTLLELKNPALHVINRGVSGYGMGQIYLSLLESIEDYKPDLTIAAFTTDDLQRTLLSFRDYKKPRFVLSGNRLILKNTPIGPIDSVYAEVRLRHETLERRGGFRFLTPVVIGNLWRKRIANLNKEDNGMRLNIRLVEEMMSVSESANSDFLLVHLACFEEIEERTFKSAGENFLRDIAAKHDLGILETRNAFLDAGRRWAPEHYHRPEAELVAGLIEKKIRGLESYREWQARGE